MPNKRPRQARPSTRHRARRREPPNAMEPLVDEAIRLQHGGRHSAAARLYQRVLKACPADVRALSGLAMACRHEGRHDPALRLLEQAVRLAPDHPGYRMNLAATLHSAGHTEAAKAAYRQAIELDSTYGDPYYSLGALLLEDGRADEAVAVFEACQTARGRDFHALAYTAHALLDAGRDTEAARLLDYERLVRRFPFPLPPGYASIDQFNAVMADHVCRHPSLRADAMATVHGEHTGELLAEPLGPMADLEPVLQQAIRWYIGQLPKDDPDHPLVATAPRAWRLSCWGVVMHDRGHERSHIHPNGWLSGVLYLELPEVVRQETPDHQGWLRFGQPTPELKTHRPPEIYDIQPRYGSVTVFPAYLYHGTVPFSSQERRVCVSFDVTPA